MGLSALPADSGANNTAIGYQALEHNSSGQDNTALGANSLGANTTGSGNIAVGPRTLSENPEGFQNIAIGTDAMYRATGSGNIAIGESALRTTHDTDSYENIAIGSWALGSLDHGDYAGQRNVAIGHYAMADAWGGEDNVALGIAAMSGGFEGGNIGSRNTAIGTRALGQNTFGSNNTAVGYYALYGYYYEGSGDVFDQSGNNNAALGVRTLRNNKEGDGNTATGYESLFSNEIGDYNTAAGSRALRGLTTGARNVAVGHQAGAALTTGNDNIIVGASNVGVASDSNVIRIGKSPNQSKTYIAGIRGVQTGLPTAAPVLIDANGQLGTLRSSREVKEDIHPMGDVSTRLLDLRPVMFRYKQAYEDGSKPVQFGLIAEDVAEVFPELVVRDASGNVETVSYHLLSSLLVNELQKEHHVNESQAARIAYLEAQVAEIAELKDAMAKMAQTVEQLNRNRQLAAN